MSTATMPEIGALCDFHNPKLGGIRMWPIRGFEKHIIYYRARESGILVIRVLHGARDAEKILGN